MIKSPSKQLGRPLFTCTLTHTHNVVVRIVNIKTVIINILRIYGTGLSIEDEGLTKQAILILENEIVRKIGPASTKHVVKLLIN